MASIRRTSAARRPRSGKNAASPFGPFFAGAARFFLAEGPEGGEVVGGEEALGDAEGLEELLPRDGLDEVGAVLLPLVGDEARRGLGGDAAAGGGVDEAVELGEEGARREAAPLGEGLEDVGLGALAPLEDALEAEGVEPLAPRGVVAGEEARDGRAAELGEGARDRGRARRRAGGGRCRPRLARET